MIEKRAPRIYCPECYEHMFNINDLIVHVRTPENGCIMTLERLMAVGVLDESDLTQEKS